MSPTTFALATGGARSVTIYRLRYDLGRGRIFLLRALHGSSDARPRAPISTPSLDSLAHDPSAITSLSRSVLLVLYQVVAPMEATIRAALFASAELPRLPAEPDRAVGLDEACGSA